MRLKARPLLLALVCAAAPALAQTNAELRDIDLVVVKPTPALNSGIALEGAEPWAPKSFRMGLTLDMNWGLMGLFLSTGTKLGDLIPFRMDGHLMAAYQLHRAVELGVDLPVTLDQQNNFALLDAYGIHETAPDVMGLGMVRVVPRATLLEERYAPVALAVVPELRLPTGDKASFMADRGVVFAPRLALERGLGPLRLLVNFGFRLRYPEQFLNLHVENEYAGGAGVILRLPVIRLPQVLPSFLSGLWLHHLQAVAEMHLTTPMSAPFTYASAMHLKTPWEVLAGIRGQVLPHLGAELDFGRGVVLNSGYGREAFRVLASLRYDFDAGENLSSDRDHDGVPDYLDNCPDEPEDMNGPGGKNGCPLPDRDHDGVADQDDLCPDEPGSRELQGCPDRDGDDIPDYLDKCPDQPGPAENDGCPIEGAPLVSIESTRLRIRNTVLFEVGKAIIKKQSYPLLDEVYAVLSKHPEIGRVRVDGHTDNTGPRALNVDLSRRRAKAVVDYLVRKGIPRTRLSFKGFGFDRPVASNETILGRAKNRRVEFTILGPGSQPGEEELPVEPKHEAAPPPPAPKPPPARLKGPRPPWYGGS